MNNSNNVIDASMKGQAASRMGACMACLALGLSLSACAIPAQAVNEAPQAQAQGPSQGLLIQGYNDTDTYIDSFTVNGAGGGNVFVSSPTTGGGKSVCCFNFNAASKAPVTIRWAASYCMYSATNKYGESYQWRKSIFREVQVPVERPTGIVPAALEVHFYPDGHVEVAVTAGHSPPRLKLPITADEQRPGASNNFPPCSHEQI
jgi:Protein of unknown function (DUF3304)